ncbi:hypothetical protein, partial [Staphylococcus felis]|uniref:hypothetical protein n=1 Tax=Staphylococcus felis TaxID=46127 RepID=UPI001EE7F467
PSPVPLPLSPFGNVTTCVVPGSPFPVSPFTHGCGLFTFVASGAVVSVTVPVSGSDVLAMSAFYTPHIVGSVRCV